MFFIVDILEFQNLDLKNIITPVNADALESYLTEAGYNKQKTEYLCNGFRYGFSLQFRGNSKLQRTSPNLKLRIGSKLELWNKVMSEVKVKRYAGPFEHVPYEHFIQSPIGLVPKDKGTKTRLIFHLSYPKNGDSVNSGIPYEFCKVVYPDFTEAVKLCAMAGRSCSCAKSDMSCAFRHVPLKEDCWHILVLKAEHPVTGKVFYFVDKCLPFGASISCKIFQDFSDSVAFIVKFKSGKDLVNYLDDYFFAALMKEACNEQVVIFLRICKDIQFPVSLEKTQWASTLIIFLGLLLNTERQLICIPAEKIAKALEMIEYFLTKKSKKVTVLETQKLCGFLNFLCKCIVPGRAFTRRLYAINQGKKLKAHHHVKIKEEHKLDLMVWKRFLNQPTAFCREFMQENIESAEEIDMYSDASGNFFKGVGAYFKESWTFQQWNYTFMAKYKPSIQYLELFGVTVAVLLWIHKLKNRRICLFCDNEAVCNMINNNSANCKNCMILIRIIALHSMMHNVRVFAKWVSTKNNGKADALSRLDFERFWDLDKNNTMEENPTKVPQEIWPLEKIWIK